jgi:hypothetical protein
LSVIRWTRSSGPGGRVLWLQTGMCPGGELSPKDQKIVEALNTKPPWTVGWIVAWSGTDSRSILPIPAEADRAPIECVDTGPSER